MPWDEPVPFNLIEEKEGSLPVSGTHAHLYQRAKGHSRWRNAPLKHHIVGREALVQHHLALLVRTALSPCPLVCADERVVAYDVWFQPRGFESAKDLLCEGPVHRLGRCPDEAIVCHPVGPEAAHNHTLEHTQGLLHVPAPLARSQEGLVCVVSRPKAIIRERLKHPKRPLKVLAASIDGYHQVVRGEGRAPTLISHTQLLKYRKGRCSLAKLPLLN
mmetsp:Transcript_3308/g.8345  ORF Transcript_3308/g.8345 Transcript_3308/m.8345 type:complete len:217 (+) Transcript_3308:815-1465(+)